MSAYRASKMGRGREKYTELEGRKYRVPQMKTKANMQFKYKHSIHSIIDCYVSVRNNVIHNRRRKIIFMKMSVKQKKKRYILYLIYEVEIIFVF